jgi:hypothetical protein
VVVVHQSRAATTAIPTTPAPPSNDIVALAPYRQTMTSARAAMHSRAAVIGPSLTLGWLAVLLCSALTAVTPIVEWSVLGLPPVAATPVVMLGMVLALWYHDLAPRLAWNAYGVAVRTGWRVATARWADVCSVWMARSAATGDRVIVQVGDHRFDVGLDRLWWLARLSPAYAARNRHLLDRMQFVRGQADPVSSDGQPPSLPRFAPLAAAVACWSAGLVVALMTA